MLQNRLNKVKHTTTTLTRRVEEDDDEADTEAPAAWTSFSFLPLLLDSRCKKHKQWEFTEMK